jgi:hypothetical protein
VSRPVQTTLLVAIGLAVVTSPATASFIDAVIPLIVILAVVVALVRLLFFYTR